MIRAAITLLGLWLSTTAVSNALAAEVNNSTEHLLPNDPGSAWAEVEKVHRALQPPPNWRTRTPGEDEVVAFQRKVRQDAGSFATKAREFITRFPTNENVADARITVVHSLAHAVAAGDPKAEAELQAFSRSVLADRSIPEDERVGVLLDAGNADFMKKVGMRMFTEGLSKLHDEFEDNSIEVARSALRQFPTNSLIYTMLVAVAQRSQPERQRELAQGIRDASGAPAGTKALAEHLLKGTKPYEVGKPLDIRFTALDGREVDLAKLKGVVLIEFWSTSCGPCIAQMPSIKAAYDKFHKRGFEVVAISLDDKESILRKFIAEKELPWPQHFDGKGWENQFAVRYGIFSIPTTWLVDKRGKLRETQTQGDLERRIESLLAER
ncbi:MAG: TlpA family protein disulfide reductase [Verrucomicrobiia bacterium]